jgi:hypothetical protein
VSLLEFRVQTSKQAKGMRWQAEEMDGEEGLSCIASLLYYDIMLLLDMIILDAHVSLVHLGQYSSLVAQHASMPESMEGHQIGSVSRRSFTVRWSQDYCRAHA